MSIQILRERMLQQKHNWKYRVFFVLGILCLILGVIGIIIPILPTTPFLILSVILFMNSSRRFLKLVLKNKIFGSYIKNYLQGKGMPLANKIVTLVLLWTAILLSIIFAVENIIVRIILMIVAAGVTIHILTIKTYKKKKRPENKP